MRRSNKDLARLDDPSLTALRVALTADPTEQERVGEAQVLDAYRAVSWRRRRSLRRPAVFATKLGVATIAGVVGLSGVATAAYTGSLPDTLQDFAHKTIKAPKAHPPTQAVGPDAKGEAAYGLCQAFAKDKNKGEDKDKGEGDDKQKEPKATPTHEPQGKGRGLTKNKDAAGADGERGQAKEKSVAYRNLVRAAGGESKVEAYCASIPKPSGEPKSSAAAKPSGEPKRSASPAPRKPSAEPKSSSAVAEPSDEPTGTPSSLPTATPTDLPTP